MLMACIRIAPSTMSPRVKSHVIPWQKSIAAYVPHGILQARASIHSAPPSRKEADPIQSQAPLQSFFITQHVSLVEFFCVGSLVSFSTRWHVVDGDPRARALHGYGSVWLRTRDRDPQQQDAQPQRMSFTASTGGKTPLEPGSQQHPSPS